MDLSRFHSLWFLTLALHACGTGPDRDDRRIVVTLAMTASPCSLVGPCGERGNPFDYQFSVDGGTPHSIGPDGVGEVRAAFGDGTHEVTLVGVQDYCTDNGPQLVSFKPYVITALGVAFLVYCPASP